MTRRPTVSIVTTAYNMGDYIEECIESVLKQDYPYVEHIIQDAGSTDSTLKILGKYSHKKYRQRVKWISEIDNGQCDGLDRALKRSTGDIILVLNADDALMPYACSWAVENLKKYPRVGAIYGDTYLIDEQSQIVGIYSAKEYQFEKLISFETVPPAQASFIKRTSLKKVGLYADRSLDTCPDFEMWVRLGSEFPVKHVFGVVTKYRVFKKPQLDSGKNRTAQRCVISKKIVLDRLFNDRKTPKSIKILKFKAYAGLYNWGAITALSYGQIKDCARFKWKSFYYSPSLVKLSNIFRSYKLISLSLAVEYITSLVFGKLNPPNGNGSMII